MQNISVKFGKRSYPIFIGTSSLSDIGKLISERKLGKQAAVISDETVSKLYGDCVLKSLGESRIRPFLHVVPDGEESKSLNVLSEIYTHLIKTGLRRDDMIIALGGGVVGDLAGFAATTYLRGVNFIQVPTTLLAQVDSSVGGKVGINHPLGKNLVGSFYQPKFVLIDPEVLYTLPKREIVAGMGEVIKYALIRDRKFFKLLEENLDTILQLANDKIVSKTINTCCKIKAHVVEKDEKESGLRRILNFGHTLGHALEAATNFNTFKHGEAVIHGMQWASWVSWKKGCLSGEKFKVINTLLNRVHIPPLPAGLNPAGLISKIKMDKKQSGRGLNLVLLKDIGKTRIETTNDLSPLIEKWLLEKQARGQGEGVKA